MQIIHVVRLECTFQLEERMESWGIVRVFILCTSGRLEGKVVMLLPGFTSQMVLKQGMVLQVTR